jgi:hypothetical protein
VSIIMYAVMDGLGDGKLTTERGNGHLDNGHASNMGNIDHSSESSATSGAAGAPLRAPQLWQGLALRLGPSKKLFQGFPSFRTMKKNLIFPDENMKFGLFDNEKKALIPLFHNGN